MQELKTVSCDVIACIVIEFNELVRVSWLSFCLQEDNRKLAVELQSAIGQNTDITEKFVRSELTRDQLSTQLHELKHKTG